MAKARAKANARPAAAGPKKPVNRVLVFLTLMAFVPFSLPTMLVLFCGLLPSLAAAVTERGPNRYAWICVGGVNFAGLMPWLLDLWFGHHTLDYALTQVTSIRMYLTAYGASAAGWAIYLAMPPIVSSVMAMTSRSRATILAASQRKLVEQWGDGVMVKEEPEIEIEL